MRAKEKEKSFGNLPTLGHEETVRAEKPTGVGLSWTALGLSKAETLKPPEGAGGIADDGRTDGARRWKAGEEILGRYVVERELGQGGMGVVYGCLDKVGGVRVAVKGLPLELSHDSVEMEEVRENFRLVGDLRHPCIAGVRTLEKDERGEFYLVMDLAEGESLRKWERGKWKEGGVSLTEAVGVLRQVASALDYAHRRKVVHRDVKPGNVMVDGKGEVKVLDFGLADQIRTSLSRASHAYRGTSGTGPYMSPEQWRGQPQDGKTDQYALGVMAYEMLAGRLPFGGSDLGVLREVVLKEEPAAIPGLPESAMGAIRRAMSKRAEERFGSCGEFVEALAGKLKDRSTARSGQNSDAAAAGGGDVFLLKVRLGKVLEEAEQEDATAREKAELERVREVFAAGEEALKARQFEAAGALFGQAEEKLLKWQSELAARKKIEVQAKVEQWRLEEVRRHEEARLARELAEVAERKEAEARTEEERRTEERRLEEVWLQGEEGKARKPAAAAARREEGIHQVQEGLFEDIWTGMERKQARKRAESEDPQASVQKEEERRLEEAERRKEARRRMAKVLGMLALTAVMGFGWWWGQEGVVRHEEATRNVDTQRLAREVPQKAEQERLPVEKKTEEKHLTAQNRAKELESKRNAEERQRLPEEAKSRTQEAAAARKAEGKRPEERTAVEAAWSAVVQTAEQEEQSREAGAARKPSDFGVKLQSREAESAFHDAQMLEMAGDPLGASDCYKRVEDIESDRGTKRTMQVLRAQMLVKAAEQRTGTERNKLLDEAAKLCTDLQWGGLDVQFVDSVVVQAYVELARGNRDKARGVLEKNMPVIKPIDDILAGMGRSMKESPMASARSFLGLLLKEDAEMAANDPAKPGAAVKLYSLALTEYYNVFVKYGDSSWGPPAGRAVKEIKGILESKYGKTVTIDIPDQTADAGSEFSKADNLFRQQKYDEAAAAYLKALEQFPDAGDLSVAARAQLLQCYMKLDRPLDAKKVADELGARFAKKSAIPAKALLSAGAQYDKRQDAAMSKYMFDAYLKYCPGDEQADKILFWLASKAEAAGHLDEANAYLAQIIADYKDGDFYAKALGKYAWKAYADQDYETAVEGMKIFIEEALPSPHKAQAIFALGASYRAQGKLSDAVEQFKKLVDALTPENNPYANTPEDRNRNKKLLEQARFYLAFCMSRLEMPDPAKSKAMKLEALQKLDSFINDYPHSSLGAKALELKESLQMAIGDAGANDTYAKLAREFPDTDEGKNAHFVRSSGALDLGRTDQAKKTLAVMLLNASSYSLDEFVRVGQDMLSHGLWDEATKAFGQVVSREDELASRDERAHRSLMECALYGLGEARYELGDAKGANEVLKNLLTRWPTSSMFFKANFIMARARLDSGDRQGALLALKDIFSRASEPELVNDAKLLYAQIMIADGNDTQAFAIYKGIEYFGTGNIKSEKERHQVSEALLAAIDLGEKLKRPGDVVESCDAFLRLFPTSPKVQEVRTKRMAWKQKMLESE